MKSYDIILENLEKDCENLMRQWEVPIYSKKAIDRAGKEVAKAYLEINNANQEQENISIINNWRASHAFPLQEIAEILEKEFTNAIVVQRIKRLDSIIKKLEKKPDMSLFRMQDLGGSRVIVESMSDLYDAVDRFKNMEKYNLKKENDYIKNPKPLGYRSIHLVYQYYSGVNPKFNNMLIEIQFRTKLQHVWATAVEIMGLYTNTPLKASIGDADTLRFFSIVSSIFAIKENSPTGPDTSNDYTELVKELRELDKKTNIVSRLSIMGEAINKVEDKWQKAKEKKTKGYFILILDYKVKSLKIFDFPVAKFVMATKLYNEVERQSNNEADVVLVAATSFEAMREAYPNYFVDIRQFEIIIKEILN